MAQGKSTKNLIVGIIALAVIVAVGIGAYKGRNTAHAPADTSPSAVTADKGKNNDKSGESTDEGLLEVRTWTRKDCSLAPWLVTDKLGYFKEEGIKLVFTGEIQPNQGIPSILNGNNDVSSAHPNNLAVAVAGGAKLRGVARAGIEPDEKVDPKFRHMWWFVNPEKYPNVKSLTDLKNIKGKLKFSTITTNICSDFLAYTLADKYRLPREKIEWVTMPDIQAIQAVKQGLVDVAGVHPPFYKGMQDAGQVKIADSTETGLGASAGVGYYYFTDDYIKKNPDAVKRFVRAIKRGQKWANANPDQAAKWTEEAIGVPVTGNHYYAENSTIIESEIDPWLIELEKSGVIPKGKLKPADLITHEFEKYGNQE
ncbi:MAG: ABC transporter substrate-binding protein [Clostridia bacterium]|nr:ABC transporter substrate-binding protein [Clostridia bacterium]